jgi:hypothetical protein
LIWVNADLVYHQKILRRKKIITILFGSRTCSGLNWQSSTVAVRNLRHLWAQGYTVNAFA